MKQDIQSADLARFTWLLTGNERLAAELIETSGCDDGEAWDPPSLIRTFLDVHRLGLWPDAPAEEQDSRLPLWSLPPLERAAFILRYLLHMPAPQAASELNLPVPSFSRIIARAAAFLANAAQGRPIDEGAVELTAIYQN